MCTFILSLSSYERKVDKLKNALNYCNLKMTWTASFFVFSLLCCKYMCDIYLIMLVFNGLRKFNSIFINKITTCRSI